MSNNLTKNFSFITKPNVGFEYKEKIINSLLSIEEKLKLSTTFDRSIMNECRGIYENIIFQFALSENLPTKNKSIGEIKYVLTHSYDFFDAESYNALTYVSTITNDGSHSSRSTIEKTIEDFTIIQTLKGIQILLKTLFAEILHIEIDDIAFTQQPYSQQLLPNVKAIVEEEKRKENEAKFISNNLSINKRRITKLLKFKETIYRIPIYQRGYAWDITPNISDFIMDIDECIKEKPSHYFGVIAKKAIIDHSSEFRDFKIEKIIDGQQRLTTSMLFLCAARDVLRDKHQISWKDNKILQDFFTVIPGRKLSHMFHIPGKNDNKVALDCILDELSVPLAYQKTRYYVNYKKMYDTIFLKQDTDDIFNMIVAFDECFEVAEIDFDSEKTTNKNEMEIFEDLNSKGKALTFYELIKNFLFNMCSEEILSQREEEIVDYFNSSFIFPKLLQESAKEREMQLFLESYIHYFTFEELPKDNKAKMALSLINKALQKAHPNQKLDNLDFNGYKKIIDYLSRYFKIYVSIRFDELNLNFIKFSGMNFAINLIDNKKKTPIYPMIYLLADGFNMPSEMPYILDVKTRTKIFNLVMFLIEPLIKNMYIKGQGDSDINRKYYSKISQASSEILRNRTETNYDVFIRIATELDQEVGSIEEFKMHIHNESKQTWATKALLRIVEWKMNNIPPTKENTERSTQSIEHIMPQKGLDKWKNDLINWGASESDLKEEYRNHLNLIGNFILLSGSENGSLGNKTFFEKLSLLQGKKTPLFDNNNALIDVSKKTQWTFKNIEDRTNALINYIESIWMKLI